MSLVGTYVHGDSGSILKITVSDNTIGEGQGIFIMGDIQIPIVTHYHFVNGGLEGTTILFSGFQDRPNHYVGSSGYSETTDARTGLRLAGGLTIHKNVIPFSGLFMKV